MNFNSHYHLHLGKLVIFVGSLFSLLLIEVAAEASVAGQLPGAVLPADYELSYLCLKTDVRTAAVKASELSDLQKNLHYNLLDGTITQTEVRNGLNYYNSKIYPTLGPQTIKIVLSAHNRNIYYKRYDKNEVQVTLYDAITNKTYTRTSNYNRSTGASSNAQIDTGEISPGLNSSMMPEVPLIGSSPNVLPIISTLNQVVPTQVSSLPQEITCTSPLGFEGDGEAPTVSTLIDEPSVAHVRYLKDGTYQILDCTEYQNSLISQIWRFSDYQWKLNCWIPGRITFINYDSSSTGDNSTAPATVYDYGLISAKPEASDALFSGPSGLFPNLTLIQDRYVGSPVSFFFRPNKGTFAEQMAAARYQEKISASVAEGGNEHSSNSLIIIGSVLCASAIWLIWRRRKALN